MSSKNAGCDNAVSISVRVMRTSETDLMANARYGTIRSSATICSPLAL